MDQHEQFRQDMMDAGLEVCDYQGRNFYSGPAVVIHREALQDVIRATKVRVKTNDMGKDNLIVYPETP